MVWCWTITAKIMGATFEAILYNMKMIHSTYINQPLVDITLCWCSNACFCWAIFHEYFFTYNRFVTSSNVWDISLYWTSWNLLLFRSKCKVYHHYRLWKRYLFVLRSIWLVVMNSHIYIMYCKEFGYW
jgi:hypothetical protein